MFKHLIALAILASTTANAAVPVRAQAGCQIPNAEVVARANAYIADVGELTVKARGVAQDWAIQNAPELGALFRDACNRGASMGDQASADLGAEYLAKADKAPDAGQYMRYIAQAIGNESGYFVKALGE